MKVCMICGSYPPAKCDTAAIVLSAIHNAGALQ